MCAVTFGILVRKIFGYFFVCLVFFSFRQFSLNLVLIIITLKVYRYPSASVFLRDVRCTGVSIMKTISIHADTSAVSPPRTFGDHLHRECLLHAKCKMQNAELSWNGMRVASLPRKAAITWAAVY